MVQILQILIMMDWGTSWNSPSACFLTILIAVPCLRGPSQEIISS
jgi:hypothetical protein